MSRHKAILAVLVVAAWCGAKADDDAFVTVEQGRLLGKVVTSVLGDKIYSFLGIPYAKAPLGPLRFKDAQPPESWKGTRNATKAGSKCTQFDANLAEYGGEENCLFLNVYTPRMPGWFSKRMPVMVWIHGGGYVFGSAADDEYGPDFLVPEGVVLVTINYRLSCFGFLFLKKAAPGNVGLKDQVAALRWVNKNIAAFNGDPQKVTIFGESSGASSAIWHMLSPMSEGLFHGAIAQSGAPTNRGDQMWKPYETSQRLASAVGCTDGGDDKKLECLRKVDHMKLIKAAETEAPLQRDRDRLMMFSFTPTAEEEKVKGVETFAPGPPEQLIRNGCQHDVPFMTGVSDQEWMLTVAMNKSVFASEDDLRIYDSDWEKYVLPETRLKDNNSKIPKAMQKLREFFLHGQPLTSKNVYGYRNMLSDLQTDEGMYYTLKYFSKSKKSDTFVYLFTVNQELNFLKTRFHLTYPGASHADELGYLFRINSLPELSSDNPAFITRKRMVRLWTNFAKFGTPTPNKDSLIGVKWKPYTRKEHNYLDIGNDIKTGQNLYADRVTFWEKFYKKFGSKWNKDGIFQQTCSSSNYSFLSWIFSIFP